MKVLLLFCAAMLLGGSAAAQSVTATHSGSITTNVGAGILLNSPTSVFVFGTYAYVTSSAANALEIVDISDPTSPKHKASITGAGGGGFDYPRFVYVKPSGAYIYMLI